MFFLIVLHPYLMRTFVTAVEQKWPMQALTESGHRFKNLPAARYATYVTFQQTNVPHGAYTEKKLYYSSKRSLYGHKVEVSVTSFDESIDSHLANLAKRTSETTLEDSEPGIEQWAVLAGKGYQAIEYNLRAVLPLKKPVGGILTFAEQAKNDRIASDRVIVGNYFGRLKTLWATCSNTYRWSRKSYDIVFQACLALTNVHIRLHPLRAEDGDANAQYINRLNAIGAKIIKTKRAARKAYMSKRKVSFIV
ncbi:hypothetical protein H257_16960 [Aphanomyces astaci]|uniref:DDE Tnp4 domain-containing protein n=1 Tax=Aphanomyces astaci TaxID=112090 RepID=W4FIV7_APHAT|nr:hypothetical protein H257_16960 [Aphanomyces astaci]ETV66658.1 hypothetical protein H257_16960 [Aphanomyces astaci]|eukprot:XP_009843886.1 hypothetical protein H257_16960 [Aphanomyces astaci]